MRRGQERHRSVIDPSGKQDDGGHRTSTYGQGEAREREGDQCQETVGLDPSLESDNTFLVKRESIAIADHVIGVVIPTAGT